MELCPLIAKWTLPPDGYFEMSGETAQARRDRNPAIGGI